MPADFLHEASPGMTLPMESPLRSLGRRLSPGSFGRNVGVLAIGTLVGQTAVVLAAPLLARLYAPVAFGTLGVFIALVAIIQMVSALGYQKAIPVPEKARESQALVAGAIAVTVTTVTLVALSVALWGDRLAEKLGVPGLIGSLWLVPIAVGCAQLYEILSQWTVRHKEFGALSQTKLAQGLGMVAGQIGLGLAGAGAFGLILGDIVGRMVGNASLLRKWWKTGRSNLAQLRAQEVCAALWRYRQFPMFQSPYMLVNQLGVNTPALLVAMLYGPAAAGAWFLAHKILQAPLLVIGRSVARVYLGEAAELARTRSDRLRSLVGKTFCGLFLVAFVPITAISAASPWTFAFIFGKQWQAAGLYTAILGLPLLLQFAIAPLLQTLVVTQRQPWMLAWAVLRFSLVAAAISGAHLLSLPAVYAVMFYGAATAITYVCGIAMLFLVLPRPAATSIVPFLSTPPEAEPPTVTAERSLSTGTRRAS